MDINQEIDRLVETVIACVRMDSNDERVKRVITQEILEFFSKFDDATPESLDALFFSNFVTKER